MANDSSVMLHIRVSSHTKRTMERHAKQLGKTQAGIVREALEAFGTQRQIEEVIDGKLGALESRIMEAVLDGSATNQETLAEVKHVRKILGQ